MAIQDIATTESRRKGALQKRANADIVRRRTHTVDNIVAGMTAEDIPAAAYDYVLASLARLSEALPDIKVETPLDAVRVATAADLAFRIARLAAGESTANVAHAKVMTDAERHALLARLRGKAADQAELHAAPPTDV
jgi:hypothetical protein